MESKGSASCEASSDVTDSEFASEPSSPASPSPSTNSLAYSPPGARVLTPFSLMDPQSNTAQGDGPVATISQSSENASYSNSTKNRDYEMQLRLLEQQNRKRLFMAKRGLNGDVECHIVQQDASLSAPVTPPTNEATSKLSSLADYARIPFQIQQQQEGATTIATTINPADMDCSHPISNSSTASNVPQFQRSNLERSKSTCSSGNHHSVPCNAAAANLLEATLSTLELTRIQNERNNRARLQATIARQQQIARERVQDQRNYQAMMMMRESQHPHAGLTSANRMLPFQTSHGESARYNQHVSDYYPAGGNSGGPINHVSTASPSHAASRLAFRTLSQPDSSILTHDVASSVSGLKRSSANPHGDEHIAKKTRHAMPDDDSPTHRNIYPSRSPFKLSSTFAGAEDEDDVYVDDAFPFSPSRKSSELPTGAAARHKQQRQDEETRMIEEEINHPDTTTDRSSDTQDKPVPREYATTVASHEDKEAATEHNEVHDKASPARSSATLSAIDDHPDLDRGNIDNIHDTNQNPTSVLYEIPVREERVETRCVELAPGLEILTITQSDGTTVTKLKIGANANAGGIQSQMRQRRRETVEIVTRTMIQGQGRDKRVETTTTTALIPLMRQGWEDDTDSEDTDD